MPGLITASFLSEIRKNEEDNPRPESTEVSFALGPVARGSSSIRAQQRKSHSELSAGGLLGFNEMTLDVKNPASYSSAISR